MIAPRPPKSPKTARRTGPALARRTPVPLGSTISREEHSDIGRRTAEIEPPMERVTVNGVVITGFRLEVKEAAR